MRSKKCYCLPQDSLSHSVKLPLTRSLLFEQQLEPKHLTNLPPSSAATQSFTSVGVLRKYNFVYCCVSQCNGHTLRVLGRTFEIRGTMRQEGATDYRHAGREHIRLQPLVREEVTYHELPEMCEEPSFLR